MLKLISALLSSLLVMESAVAVDEQNPAGDQLVKRGDAIQSIKGSDKIFTGEVKIVPLSEPVRSGVCARKIWRLVQKLHMHKFNKKLY